MVWRRSGPRTHNISRSQVPSRYDDSSNMSLLKSAYFSSMILLVLPACPLSIFDSSPVSDGVVAKHVPEAKGQSLQLRNSSYVSITLEGVDSDSSHTLTYSVVSGGSTTNRTAHGTLYGTAPSVIYVPDGGYVGSDSFSFTVSDSGATSAPATISIEISGVQTLMDFVPHPFGANPNGILVSGTTLYGVAAEGGLYGRGTIFKMNLDGSGAQVLHNFRGVDGANPVGQSLSISNGVLYGVTYSGGTAYVYGTVFRIGLDGQGFRSLHSFGGGADGSEPVGKLLVYNGSLVGVTSVGGTGDNGTVFSIGLDGKNFSILHRFDGTNGRGPVAGLTLVGEQFWGTTGYGGSNGDGTIFKIDVDGSDFLVQHHFLDGNGATPTSTLLLSGSTLYGSTQYGGVGTAGTIFKFETSGAGFTSLLLFSAAPNDPKHPFGNLILEEGVLMGTLISGGPDDAGGVFSLNTDGSGLEVLHVLSAAEGTHPEAVVVSGNMLYGIAGYGNLSDKGSVYRLQKNGTGFELIFDFNPLGGAKSFGTLLLDDGEFYGTTSEGGVYNKGSVFRVGVDGENFTMLHQFNGADGANPKSSLVVSGSKLFGTTRNGGVEDRGTVFSLNLDGTAHDVLHEFTISDGILPESGVLVDGSMVYGTTPSGGVGMFSSGTVYRVSNAGTGFTVLHEFTAHASGLSPLGGLVMSGSTLYGSTRYGGDFSSGTLFSIATDGSGFQKTFNFHSSNTGGMPTAKLLLSGSRLYGSTFEGGAHFDGVVFGVNLDGSNYEILHHFDMDVDGAYPTGPLVLEGSTLYGMTKRGGEADAGVGFSIGVDGQDFSILFSLSGELGGTNSEGGLVKIGDTFYGSCNEGGSSGNGNLFRFSAP
jgi:uncharacterized repeat protein (TIGR03803 family)